MITIAYKFELGDTVQHKVAELSEPKGKLWISVTRVRYFIIGRNAEECPGSGQQIHYRCRAVTQGGGLIKGGSVFEDFHEMELVKSAPFPDPEQEFKDEKDRRDKADE